ncbi:MAG: kynureninase [Prolixibacteraceae bacterium]|nr:kynureninase [Prolixibacteraceae bacterium]MBN2773687.1 kynureninase [Prolixibacteraceae bacterium]
MNYSFKNGIEFARSLDHNDLLKEFRNEFFIADKNIIYLDGNSLGRLTLKSEKQLLKTIKSEWGENLIESWNKIWYSKPLETGNKIAQIIGASPGEVIVSDSTSVNLYKLAMAALKLQKERSEIVSDVFNFPTDLYILQGIIGNLGNNHKLILAESNDGISIGLENLESLITEKTALFVLSHVAFKSSFKYDIKKVTDIAHKKGALVLWDLSHSIGATEIELNKWNVDLAVGCTYKYLNGGPGSPAFLYIRKDLLEKLDSPIQGWFGDSKPFAFDLEYNPAKGILKFLTGTPPVLNLMAIEPALDIILKAGIKNINEKSKKQSEYLLFLIKNELLNLDFKIGSPENPEDRGSHISLQHREAYRICQALINPENSPLKVIPDFREPDNIRLGIAPLYTTFEEIYLSVKRIKEIVEKEEYKKYSSVRNKVT